MSSLPVPLPSSVTLRAGAGGGGPSDSGFRTRMCGAGWILPVNRINNSGDRVCSGGEALTSLLGCGCQGWPYGYWTPQGRPRSRGVGLPLPLLPRVRTARIRGTCCPREEVSCFPTLTPPPPPPRSAPPGPHPAGSSPQRCPPMPRKESTETPFSAPPLQGPQPDGPVNTTHNPDFFASACSPPKQP